MTFNKLFDGEFVKVPGPKLPEVKYPRVEIRKDIIFGNITYSCFTDGNSAHNLGFFVRRVSEKEALMGVRDKCLVRRSELDTLIEKLDKLINE